MAIKDFQITFHDLLFKFIRTFIEQSGYLLSFDYVQIFWKVEQLLIIVFLGEILKLICIHQ